MRKIAGIAVVLAGLVLAGCAAPTKVSTNASPPPASSGTDTGGGGGDERSNVTTVGQWATAEDGIAFRVSKLKRGRVSQYAYGGRPGDPAVVATVQFRNRGTSRFDTTMIDVQARVGVDGVEAEQVFDHRFGDGFTGTLAPGRTATTEFMFAAAKVSDLARVSVEVTPGLEYDSATFEGGVR